MLRLKRKDEETGLHYNRYRYYEPHSGRYVSKDPIGLVGGLNNSAYVRDPNLWVDPLGLNGNKIVQKNGNSYSYKKTSNSEAVLTSRKDEINYERIKANEEVILNQEKRKAEINDRIKNQKENLTNRTETVLVPKRVVNVDFYCDCTVTLWGSFKESLYSGEVRDNIYRYGLGQAHNVSMGTSTKLLEKTGYIRPELLDEDHVSFKTGDYTGQVLEVISGQGAKKIYQGYKIDKAVDKVSNSERFSTDYLLNRKNKANELVNEGTKMIIKDKIKGEMEGQALDYGLQTAEEKINGYYE